MLRSTVAYGIVRLLEVNKHRTAITRSKYLALIAGAVPISLKVMSRLIPVL